jgi:hypothetical protein
MNRGLLYLFAAGVVFSGSALVRAQNTPKQEGMMNGSEPPKVIRIYREDLKPGKQVAHEKVEAAYVRAFSKANWPIHYLALNAISGPSEAWFVEAHDSFASIQKEEQAFENSSALKTELAVLDQQDGDLRTGGRGIIAVSQPDLSYRADRLNDSLPKDRYMSVMTLHIKPGQDSGFREAAKLIHAGDEKAGVDMPIAMYQVVSGMSGGTYFLFSPMNSLEYYDSAPTRSKAIHEAMGENWDKFESLVSQCITNSESALFSLDPKMSYVSKEFASADPTFWNPKPAMPVRAKGPAPTRAAKPAE